ncbi:hypothetical protein U1Q18_037448 [Sarracenia purpurea var. burkii]
MSDRTPTGGDAEARCPEAMVVAESGVGRQPTVAPAGGESIVFTEGSSCLEAFKRALIYKDKELMHTFPLEVKAKAECEAEAHREMDKEKRNLSGELVEARYESSQLAIKL